MLEHTRPDVNPMAFEAAARSMRRCLWGVMSWIGPPERPPRS